MLQKYLHILFFMIPWVIIHAQKEDYIWPMGREASTIDSSVWNGFDLDFNTPSLRILKNPKGVALQNHNVSICDENGNLILYSNGCYFLDGNHNIVPGSDSLNPIYDYYESCYKAGPRGLEIPQTGILLPNPGNPYWYDYFHLEIYLNKIPPRIPFIFSPHLLHTRIEIAHDGKEANTIFKNIAITNDTFANYGMIACKHANQKDWWLITRKDNSNFFYIHLITSDSIIAFKQSFGNKFLREDLNSSSVSPQGNYIAFYSQSAGLELMSFDRNSGLLSNYQIIEVLDTSFYGISGIAFSPNSQYLYVSTIIDLFQFDVTVSDIKSSEVHIANAGNFICGNGLNQSARFWNMILAPDCRIYMAPVTTQKCMHVILNPNNKGKACNFVLGGLSLPYKFTPTIPNFPHYRMDEPYPCDSTIRFITKVSEPGALRSIFIYPNPGGDIMNVMDENNEIIALQLLSINGTVVKEKYFPDFEYNKIFNVEGIQNGIYLLRIFLRSGDIYTEKISVVR